MNRMLVLIILILSPTLDAFAGMVELTPASTEAEIVKALTLTDGEMTSNGTAYLVENGVVYKLIRGKRFRPRCIVKEMEEILPGVRIPGLFASNSAQPTHEYLPLLDRLGHALSHGALAHSIIRVVAYTDGTGSEPYNRRLSERRALRIKQHLATRAGVAPARLLAVGMGVFDPLLSYHSGKDRAKTRSVQIRLLGTSSGTIPDPCEKGAD